MIVWADPWGTLLRQMRNADLLEHSQVDHTRLAGTPEEAVEELRRALGDQPED